MTELIIIIGSLLWFLVSLLQNPGSVFPINYSSSRVEISEEKLDQFYNWFKVVDPDQQGVVIGDEVRAIFPRTGWNVVFAYADELVSRGYLSKSFTRYTWIERP